jgi:hypothetical protein
MRTLPYDYARCSGQEWEPFGVQPQCIDCLRRLSPPNPRMQSYIEPSKERECSSRIAESDDGRA